MPSKKEIIQKVLQGTTITAENVNYRGSTPAWASAKADAVLVALSAAEKERNGSGDRSLLTRVLEESPSLPGGGWRVSRGLATDIEAHLGDGYDWEHPGREGEPGQMVTTAREVARWAYKQGVGEALAVDHLCDEVLTLRAREGDVIEKLREWIAGAERQAAARHSDWYAGQEALCRGLLVFLNDLQEQSTEGDGTSPGEET